MGFWATEETLLEKMCRRFGGRMSQAPMGLETPLLVGSTIGWKLCIWFLGEGLRVTLKSGRLVPDKGLHVTGGWFQ